MGLFSNKKTKSEAPRPDTFNFGAPRVPNLERLKFPEPKLIDRDNDLNLRTNLSKEMGSIKQSLSKPIQPNNNYDREPIQLVSKKSLFIKVEKYREAMHYIEEIKHKIGEAETALVNLDRTRKQEEVELEKWRRDIETVKRKLISIDSTLFKE